MKMRLVRNEFFNADGHDEGSGRFSQFAIAPKIVRICTTLISNIFVDGNINLRIC